MNDPVAEWNQKRDEKMARGKSKSKAIQELARENPDLHRAYLVAYNREHGRASAVAQRFGSPQ